ncbi:MAG: lactonase family protein [Gemmatirosa sp.]
MSDPDGYTRRDFLTAAAAIGVAGCAAMPHAPPAPRAWRLYVGTYTNDGRSRGIYRLEADRETGALRADGVAAEAVNPSFLALTPDGRTLLAVSERTEYEGRASGAVLAFARDRATGVLTARGAQPSGGGAPCYVSVDRAGRHALVANYVGGSVAALPIGADGALGAARVVQHAGRGPHAARQTSPHAHAILVDAPDRHALATDLGIDRVIAYRLDATAGTLTPTGEAVLRPGAGPRHLAFAPDGRTLYVVNELDSTLTALAYDDARGALRELHTLATRPTGATGENFPGDLHVHPSGRAVYASNRGDDTIAVFAVDGGSGRLALVQSVPTVGRWPRNFALDPTGRFLLVANQRSESVVAFRVDAATGTLTPTGSSVAIPSPVCLLFADA